MARRYHHGDLRSTLIRAAFALVRRDGVDAVSLRAVARRAKVSEAAPYHHFRDKADLLAACAARGFALLAARLGAAGDDVAAMAEAYVRFAVEEQDAFRMIFGAHVAALGLGEHAETRAAAEAAKAPLFEAVRALVPEADVARAFRLLWAQVHGTAWLLVEDELGPGWTVEDAVALARDGVARLLATLRGEHRAEQVLPGQRRRGQRAAQ